LFIPLHFYQNGIKYVCSVGAGKSKKIVNSTNMLIGYFLHPVIQKVVKVKIKRAKKLSIKHLQKKGDVFLIINQWINDILI
jgi:hypothetical protein